jgi:hypothetical protein
MDYDDAVIPETPDGEPPDYDDEYFDNGLIEDDSVYATDSTIDSVKKRQRKKLQEYKQIDKGYRRLVRHADGKAVNVELYLTSYVPGKTIRDAVTGHYFKGFHVGTKDEDNFFKVKWAAEGSPLGAGHFYFETPSQSEKHLRISLSDKTKKKWTDKYDEYSKTLSDQKE